MSTLTTEVKLAGWGSSPVWCASESEILAAARALAAWAASDDPDSEEAARS